MAEQEIDIVRAFLDRVAERDIPGALGMLAADVVWVAPDSLPYGGTYRSPQEVAERYFGGFLEHFDDDFELAPEELIEAGDRVVVRLRVRVHGRLSGLRADAPAAQIWTVRDRKIAALEYHVDTAALLGALEGLPATAGGSR